MNINTPQGLSRFLTQFRDRGDSKKNLVVEAALPDLHVVAETAEEKPAPAPASEQRTAAVGGGESAVPSTTDLPVVPPKGQPSVAQVQAPTQLPAAESAPNEKEGPALVVNHLAGRVFHSFPELVTSIPRLADGGKNGIQFTFQNRGQTPREVEILLRGPDGAVQYKGRIAGDGRPVSVLYPRDFGVRSTGLAREGEYAAEVKVDGQRWCADAFEVALPREADPKVLTVKVPSTVEAGKSFTVSVEAQNRGAESDYGGITISSPNPSGLRLVSAARPARLYAAGSTVLAVTSDKIHTKVAMAERWIELWGEKKAYDLKVQVQAGRPGTYPLYVRCALRGVNVKSSVILMDPGASDTVDQQGFPVKVYQITVR